MNFAISFKKFLIVALAGLALTACATQKKQSGQMQVMFTQEQILWSI